MVKSFGRERVLDGVDLTVPAGAITVLLGPSGAGKTVTISHVVGPSAPIAAPSTSATATSSRSATQS